jgi:uncharacterized protein (DUF2132 family)
MGRFWGCAGLVWWMSGALHSPACATECHYLIFAKGLMQQANNPLHGKTLEAIVTELADYYGWEGLGERVPIRCFTLDPSVGSSLKFLRKTPWARDKVESLYLFMQREIRRAGGSAS